MLPTATGCSANTNSTWTSGTGRDSSKSTTRTDLQPRDPSGFLMCGSRPALAGRSIDAKRTLVPGAASLRRAELQVDNKRQMIRADVGAGPATQDSPLAAGEHVVQRNT